MALWCVWCFWVDIGPKVCRSVEHVAHNLMGTLCAVVVAIITV